MSDIIHEEDEYLKDKEKRRKNRYSYLDDFKMTSSGKYEYMGRMWEYTGEYDFKELKKLFLILVFIVLIFSVSSGFIATPGASYKGYILVPYSLELVGVLVTAFKLVSMFRKGEKLRDYEYKSLRKQLSFYYWLTAVGSAVSLIGEIVFLILNGAEGKVFLAILYIVSRLICTLLTIYALKSLKMLNYDIVAKE